MKLSRTLTMSVLVVAAVGAGAGTAVAAPPNAGFDPSQPLLTPTAESNSQAALMLFPGNDPKQAAFDTMANEVNIGWNNGGLQSTLIGANLGVGIGCLSIFPNFIAGCIVGGVIGTVCRSRRRNHQRKPERCAGRREVLRDSLSSAQLCVCPGVGVSS